MNVNLVNRGAATLSAAGLGLALLSTPAEAVDPPPGTFPTLAGACSDTVAPVLNAIGGTNLGCWGPLGSPTIQTRPTGCQTARPNGSSAAIAALNNDIALGTHCLDFAGVTRGPNNMSTNDLSWLRFARDGVTVAVRTDSGLVDHDFTTAELQDIYRCEVTTVDVGGRAIAVRPLLPEVGSGTGAYWAAVMGISSTMPPSCVGGAQEHDGRSLVNEGDLMPFSIPQFIAQVNGVATNRLGAADIRPVDGVNPYTQSLTFNTSFPIARDVYVVVETARLTETAIAAAFVGSGSLVCDDAAITELHGFGSLANCGSVAFTGES